MIKKGNLVSQKFNFKTRTFIVFIIFTIILNLNNFISSLFSFEVFLYNKYILFYSLIYLISIILLFKNSDKSKKLAWILALIPALGTLFNPSSPITNPDIAQGTLIALVQSVMWNDITTALIMLITSLVPIVIIIYSIIELIPYKNNKFDLAIGILFMIFFCCSFFLIPIISILDLNPIDFNNYIRPLLISIFYVGLVLLWAKFDKKK